MSFLAMLLSFVRTMLTQSEAQHKVNSLKCRLVLRRIMRQGLSKSVASFATCRCPQDVYHRD